MQVVLRHLNLPDNTLRVPQSPNGYRMMSRPSPSSSSDTNLPPAHQTLDHSTTIGAEALLAQTEISDDFFSPRFPPTGGSPSTPPPSGLFNILDDLLNSGPYNNAASPASSKSSESIGELDPRPNVIKLGAINPVDANVLVDQLVFYLFLSPIAPPPDTNFISPH